MALSVAIPLSGLEIDQFNNLAHHLLMNKIDFKLIHPDVKSSSSSLSTKSDSSYTSGISSLVSFSSYATPSSSTPISSTPSTPSKDKENSDCNLPTDTNVIINSIVNKSQKSTLLTIQKSTLSTIQKSNSSTIQKSTLSTMQKSTLSIAQKSNLSTTQKSNLSTTQKSNFATDICELNQFYRQLLQLPISQIYRPVGKSRRCLVKSQKATNKLKIKPQMKIIYKQRDILNLEANLREPSWQMRTPAVPKHNIRHFMSNRSIHYRLGNHGLIEDYPTRDCDECGFKVPSSFLF